MQHNMRLEYAMNIGDGDHTWQWHLHIDGEYVGAYASASTALKMAALESGIWQEVVNA